MSDQLLDDLNPPQREAVTTTEGPLLIIAGAGSGKTRVITYRVAYLVRECGVLPGQVLAATFTNKAADEMRERVRRLLAGDRSMPFAISTFHAWCARVLRHEAEKAGIAADFTICNEDDQISVLKEVFRARGLDPKSGPVQPSQARWVIDQAKMKLEGPDDVRRRPGDRVRAELYGDIYATYQQMLHRNNALDFGDLIAEVVHLFETDHATLDRYQEHYRYLMVDEYQDTNHVQYRLIAALAAKRRNICVVGDEDQSIYSWRGADIGNLLDFQKQFPDAKLIRLEQNYRSTQNILNAASQVIAYNRERLGKTLWTARGAGPPILGFEAASDRDESDQVVRLIEWFHDKCFLPYREMAVFYRTNALSRLMEERLRGADIAYRVVGAVRFYDRKEIKDVLAYLRVIANPYDSMALARIINTPRRGIGDKTVGSILARAMRDNRTVFETIEAMRSEGAFGKAADRKIADFVAQMKEWIEYARSSDVVGLLDRVLKDTSYVESLGDPALLEVISRRENIEELRNAIAQYEKDRPDATLHDFLEYTSLRTSVDEYEADENSVSLMTLHCAKGLEFRVVFLVALEEDIFPHFLSVKERGLEEERRLFYVGVTRAKDVLCLSCAGSRYTHGQPQWNPPSLFLKEIPNELMQWPKAGVLAEIRAHLASLGTGGDGGAGVLPVSDRKPARRRGRRHHEMALPAKQSHHWEAGQSLVHPTLGRGTIVEVRGDRRNEMLLIEFEDGQRMEFMARFARLKRE
jgi:DNA helicase-2/ATP-dependent DNA helicase PcrA